MESTTKNPLLPITNDNLNWKQWINTHNGKWSVAPLHEAGSCIFLIGLPLHASLPSPSFSCKNVEPKCIYKLQIVLNGVLQKNIEKVFLIFFFIC